MASVTGRISAIKQPRGGYVKPSEFDAIIFNDGIILNADENIPASLVGLTVDYLTRFVMGNDIAEAFKISLQGAMVAEKFGVNKAINIANKLLGGIKGIDEASIINACKLVTFDVWFRNPVGAMMVNGYNEIKPDNKTVMNIQTMVKRSITFFEKYGPITKDGFTFESAKPSNNDTNGGYTITVDCGDGDFLTADTLWDFKVSKSKPTSKHTLQLLMYWIMGQHSGQTIFKNITKLGIFNPRLNTVYLLDISKVSADTIQIVEDEVICY